jgi:hypothetical protein
MELSKPTRQRSANADYNQVIIPMPKQAIPRLIVIILTISILSGACAPGPGLGLSPAPTAAGVAAISAATPGLLPIAQTGTISVDKMAASITQKAGKVIQALPGDPNRVIILLEESHAFTLGQVESAIILNRLYRDYGVRTIGLEGLAAGQSLNLAWAHRQPPFTPDNPSTAREDVILQTLAEGDANSVEALGLIYNDVTVAGIDNASLYAVQPNPDIWNAPYNYLYTIALAEMTDANIKSAWKGLVDQKDLQGAFDYAIQNDAWTQPLRQRLDDPTASAEDWQSITLQILAKSAELKVIISSEDAGNLKALQDYLNVVMQRSDAMAANLLKLSQANPGRPVPAVVGLMHAHRIEEQLHAAGVTLVEIRYNSQISGSLAGAIQSEAYLRMDKGQSVQGAGTLAAMLDGRRKPAPRANQPWYFRQILARQALQWMLENAYHSLGSQSADFTKAEDMNGPADEFLKALAANPNEVSLLSAVGIKITPITYTHTTDAKPPTLDFTIELPGVASAVQGKVALDLKALKAGPVTLEARLFALQQALQRGKTTPPKGIDAAKWKISSSDLWVQFTSP